MTDTVVPSIIKNADDCEWTYIKGQEGRLDRLRWKTLIGDGQADTKALTFGVFEVPEGRFLDAHFHAEHEIYFIQQGVGSVLIDKEVTEVGPGSIVYIPGNAVHGIRNTGKERLTLIWAFPNDQLSEIEYHMVDQEF